MARGCVFSVVCLFVFLSVCSITKVGIDFWWNLELREHGETRSKRVANTFRKPKSLSMAPLTLNMLGCCHFNFRGFALYIWRFPDIYAVVRYACNNCRMINTQVRRRVCQNNFENKVQEGDLISIDNFHLVGRLSLVIGFLSFVLEFSCKDNDQIANNDPLHSNNEHSAMPYTMFSILVWNIHYSHVGEIDRVFW